MQSPTNMFLLGIIANSPINPYEIVSRFEHNRYKQILGVANSSIYANIRMLHKKGYIEYFAQKDGLLPEKKMYSLTEKGVEELKESIKAGLTGRHPDSLSFPVALLLMHHFTVDELLVFLEEHRSSLEPIVDQRKEEYEFVKSMQSDVPCIPNVSSALLVYYGAKSELDTVDCTIAALKGAKEWPQSTFDTDHVYSHHYIYVSQTRKSKKE